MFLLDNYYKILIMTDQSFVERDVADVFKHVKK